MSRTLVLAVLAVLAGVLVLLVEAPPRRGGSDDVSGPSVLRLPRGAVTSVAVAVGDRRFAAMRDGAGWRVDAEPAPPTLASALDALAETLAGLRAVDAFRGSDLAHFGLTTPQARIDVTAGRTDRTLFIGGRDSAGSAFYARREGDPRIFLVGAGITSAIERVFYQLELARGGTPPG